MCQKSPTATEYLVILAVVIVIALIVIGVLGGIPGIGSGLSSSATSVALQSKPLGLINSVIGCEYSSFTFRNNLLERIRIEAIVIDNFSCPINQKAIFNSKILKPGESFVSNCYGYYECNSKTFDVSFSLNYTNLKTGAVYYEDYSASGLVSDQMPEIFLAPNREHYFLYEGENITYANTNWQFLNGWVSGPDGNSADEINAYEASLTRYYFNGSDWIRFSRGSLVSNDLNISRYFWIEKINTSVTLPSISGLKCYGSCDSNYVTQCFIPFDNWPYCIETGNC